MYVFSRYAPFIQEYIYRQGWDTIRPIQVAAAHEIFENNHNVLISINRVGYDGSGLFPDPDRAR